MAEQLSDLRLFLQMDALTDILRDKIGAGNGAELLGPQDFTRHALQLLGQFEKGEFSFEQGDHANLLHGISSEDRFSLEKRLPAIAEAVFGNEVFAKGVAQYLQNRMYLMQNQDRVPQAMRRLMNNQ